MTSVSVGWWAVTCALGLSAMPCAYAFGHSLRTPPASPAPASEEGIGHQEAAETGPTTECLYDFAKPKCMFAGPQAPRDLSTNAQGRLVPKAPPLNFLQVQALPQTNIHYHVGAEHRSDYYNDSTYSDAYDAEMAAAAHDSHLRRKLSENPRPGFWCPNKYSEAQLQPYDFQHCKGDVHVGGTYEVHYVRSSAGRAHMVDPTVQDVEDPCKCENRKGIWPVGYEIGETCDAHDKNQPYCQPGGKAYGEEWCTGRWCYVGPKCASGREGGPHWAYYDMLREAGHSVPNFKNFYSYEPCGDHDIFTPMLHGDGLSYAANNEGMLNPTVAVIARVYTLVTDAAYDDDDLFKFSLHADFERVKREGDTLVMYPGSTTGTSHDNEICSPYAITWLVDIKCNMVSANSFDKMCKDMVERATGTIDKDLHPHGSRKLMRPEFVVAPEYVRTQSSLINSPHHHEHYC